MKLILSLSLCLCFVTVAQAQNWSSFRGDNASGIADGQSPPTNWDAEKSINVLWKTPIPGLGHSSPVVWGDKVFVTTAISSNTNVDFQHGLIETGESARDTSRHSWHVYCLDKKSGRIIWDKAIYEGTPKVKRHVKSSYANSTPATDGNHLVAFFGSEGLYCFDMSGKLLWKQDLGILDGGWSPDLGAHWGFGSSPITYKGLVIVQCDSQKNSFIAAYNINDGKRVWLTPRDEDTSWSSPIIYEGKGRAELVTSGTRYYRGYDPSTGKELWRLADGTDVKIPTPVAANDMFFLGGGSPMGRRVFYAVRYGAAGEIALPAGTESNESIAWRNRSNPHIVTPIVYGGFLYACTDNGVLTAYDAKTGEQVYRERIGGKGGAFSASPIAADGKLYFSSEDGEILVLKAGAKYELLAANPMGEVVMATPAISERMIIVRGQHHIFCIKEQAALKPFEPIQ
jgi:outer membrane protein assembly factor BamB